MRLRVSLRRDVGDSRGSAASILADHPGKVPVYAHLGSTRKTTVVRSGPSTQLNHARAVRRPAGTIRRRLRPQLDQTSRLDQISQTLEESTGPLQATV